MDSLEKLLLAGRLAVVDPVRIGEYNEPSDDLYWLHGTDDYLDLEPVTIEQAVTLATKHQDIRLALAIDNFRREHAGQS